MYIGGGFAFWKHPPVHEALTICALINSDFNLCPTTTYTSAIRNRQKQVLEILRGIIWNDDPANKLFHNDPNDNFSMGIGKDFAVQFADGVVFDVDCTKHGWFGHKNIIARSHFGDMQFLHSMADEVGEKAEETKRKILTWLEVMYKVAIGEISTQTKMTDVQISGEFGEEWPFRRLFDAGTTPAVHETVHDLITSGEPNITVLHQHRALGSCVHLIQDSFARGHCQREDITEKEGTVKRYGKIISFHTYKGQDAEEHSKYDFPERLDLADTDLSSVSLFDDMDGCRDAVENSIRMINFWFRETPWDEVRDWLQEDVFVFHPTATVSNSEVG